MNNYLMRYALLSVILFPLFSVEVSASELSAELIWSKRLVLSTTVTGVVDKVLVSPGQRIKKGDVLLNLDVREFKAVLNEASAKKLAAKTTYNEAKRELVRAQDLYDRTMLSEHELQVTKNSEAQTRAGYLGAKAKLLLTRVALERSRIQAPFDSVVLRVIVQPGQTVLSNLQPEPLAVIAEADRMVARAWLPLAELEKFLSVKAQQVSVSDRKFSVISQVIAHEANEKGQYAMDVTFEVTDSNLRAGQVASIIFP